MNLFVGSSRKRPFRVFLIIFVIINSLLLIFRERLKAWQIAPDIALIGNLLLFLATFLSFLLFQKGLQQPGAYAFVRMVYSGILLKMGISIIAVLIYALLEKGQVNKGAVLLSFGFYFVYSFAEVKTLIALSKLQKNA